MEDLQSEKEYLRKVNNILSGKLRNLEAEYSYHSPYVYAIGDMENNWEFEIKKMNALQAKKTLPPKIDLLKKILESPYFGKIYIEDEIGKREIYIGENNIDHEDVNLVSSYSSSYGDIFAKKLPILSINGNKIKLFKTRHFNIHNRRLCGYKDYEVLHTEKKTDLLEAYKKYITSDFLRNQLLNRGTKGLKPIFQTIDQLQNEIIRMPVNQNVLVQGVPGSGKTTLGLHRLSYIIYQLDKEKMFTKILAICPSNLFLSYIQEQAPNLNLKSVKFQSARDIFFSILPKGINIAKPKIRDDLTYFFNNKFNIDKRGMYASWFRNKGSKGYVELMEIYLKGIKHQLFNRDYSKLHPLLTNSFMLHVLKKYETLPFNSMLLRAASYIEQRLEIIAKDQVDFILPVIKRDLLKYKLNTEKVYQGFLKTKRLFSNREFAELNFNQNKWYEEDIPALIYLSFLIDNVPQKEVDFNHIFIDEGQDLTYVQYVLLKKVFKEASFTIVGDLNQEIFLQRGIESWDFIIPLFKSRLLKLNYNYRSSKEIMNLATSTLIAPSFTGIGVIETGLKPKALKFDGYKSDIYNWGRIYKEHIAKWLQKNESIAIITNSIGESENISITLNEIGIKNTNVVGTSESNLYIANITIISALQVKGLEFDNIIVYNPSNRNYPHDVYFSKLLYMVLTRALHNIIIALVEPPSKLLYKAESEFLIENRRI
ncbi:hypothetical protein CEF21_21495 [Bacillus sp. FJAT-42376]|uniref:UvrD-helicase domain-containing protein n=1 Tax=Bacillus sp. FJAT-42376 TaxID=2014076 RepID=UPI000F510041|nr:UvrD-helicase domain-containing protein [Bacillus sp. FJAT-42376]AZB44656.1 hypothetical protein CEF21_21495 [Bacillus sp. FJAT-42376]